MDSTDENKLGGGMNFSADVEALGAKILRALADALDGEVLENVPDTSLLREQVEALKTEREAAETGASIIATERAARFRAEREATEMGNIARTRREELKQVIRERDEYSVARIAAQAERDEARREATELRAKLEIVQRNFDTAIGQRDAARDRAHTAESALTAERGGRAVTVERTARLRAQRDRDELLAAARKVLDGDLGRYEEVTELAEAVMRVEAKKL